MEAIKESSAIVFSWKCLKCGMVISSLHKEQVIQNKEAHEGKHDREDKRANRKERS